MRLSPDIAETARNIESRVLRRIADVSGTEIARLMGVDKSTITRIQTEEKLQQMAGFLAACGMTVVDNDAGHGVVTITTEKFAALKLLASEACE